MDQICTSKLMVMMMSFIVLTSVALRAINSPPSPSPIRTIFILLYQSPIKPPLGPNNPLQPSIFDPVSKKFKLGVGYVLCVLKNCLPLLRFNVAFARCEEECARKHLFSYTIHA